jgi:hypothetical protein
MPCRLAFFFLYNLIDPAGRLVSWNKLWRRGRGVNQLVLDLGGGWLIGPVGRRSPCLEMVTWEMFMQGWSFSLWICNGPGRGEGGAQDNLHITLLNGVSRPVRANALVIWPEIAHGRRQCCPTRHHTKKFPAPRRRREGKSLYHQKSISPPHLWGLDYVPPTYETVYITPWTLQNGSNCPLLQFWKITEKS